MKLKCIVLDGFKSYAHRQELDELDPHFNAITGLNGSGKSNIFDAICFVMGITNLKKVRADDTRDLIYKNGNAGIQRASVTLEFVNDDEASAPPGYSVEDFPEISIARQVICGGKQKFFLNGRIAQQSTIKAFFHSVSMNVDNPHFLVLQGTVHKLLNMKPVEVLSWIEEAAGTRMFDARKRVAEHMIMSKDKKLQEINQTLEGEVATMIEAMGTEQAEYDNYVRIADSIEHKRNFKLAYGFWKNLQTAAEAARYLTSAKHEFESVSNQLRQELPGKLQQAKSALDQSTENQLRGSANVRSAELSELLRGKQQEIHKLKTEMQLLERQRSKQEEARKKLESEIELYEKKLQSFTQDAEMSEKKFEALITERQTLEEKIDNLKNSLRMLKTGLQVGESGMTLLDEQNFIQQKILNLSSSINRLNAEEESLGNDISSLAKRRNTVDVTLKKHQAVIGDIKTRVGTLEAEYEQATKGIDRNHLRNLEEQSHRLRKQKERITSDPNLSLCQFFYEPPEGISFSDLRKNVHGRVGSFVRVRNPELHSFALSVGAQSNLRKVVVTNGETAQCLIEKCRTRERTTFFVLDSIQPVGVIDVTRQQMAYDAAAAQTAKLRQSNPHSPESWAKLALELISFPPHMKTIMDQVFGRFFVCSDLNTARSVALGQARSRAVTVDGDIVEPGGTLTGGAGGNLRDLLQIFSKSQDQLSDLNRLDDELGTVEETRAVSARKLSGAEHQRIALENARAELHVQQKMYDESCRENEKYDERRQQIVDSQKKCVAEVNGLKLDMAAQEKQLAFVKQSLEKEFDPSKKHAEFSAKLTAIQDRKAEVTALLENRQNAYDQSVGHKQELQGKVELLHRRLSDVMNEVSANTAEKEGKANSAQALGLDVEKIEEELHRHDAKTREEHIRHSERTVEYQNLKDQESSLRRSLQHLEGGIASAEKAMETAEASGLELSRAYPFLERDKAAIRDNSDAYYFQDAERTTATLQSLAEEERKLDALSKKVNKKATFMLEEAKKEFAELTAQKSALVKDKEVILKTIEQVEARKWQSLDIMVKKVSSGFSNLFHTSLPGASCRLVEQRDDGRLRGLEVKVAFQGKEKESLTELSGGQRSLLALCLILAILKFRPAPVYILDEIDAALDPSHTENIGKMLQLHFKNAQFLLVSLKDGMFANANVIYEVRHTQGFSEVRRRVNASKKKART